MMLIRLLRDRTAASAAEFGLVLPLLLFFMFGIIDGGRLMWMSNRAEKAAQMGARYAAVTDMIPSTLATRDFAMNGGVPGGNPVPTNLFSSTVCNNSTCTNSWGYDGAAFNMVVARVRLFFPEATATSVLVQYDNAGLGFAGDPNGPDVSPVITVRLVGVQFRPLVLLALKTVTLPDFASSITAEDMAGNVSN